VKKAHPDTPIWFIAHSMGCGIASLMDTSDVSGIIFVAPGVGKQVENYIARYGKDIVNGKIVKTSDGLTKHISKEFMDSATDIYWQAEFLKLLKQLPAVHVFESGADEIVDEERFELRDMSFASYTIVEGAPHNFSGKYAEELFNKIELIV
jgi:hypothetical protein